MKYFEYEAEQKKNEKISLDNLKDKKIIEQEDYQKYLRKEYSKELQRKNIDISYVYLTRYKNKLKEGERSEKSSFSSYLSDNSI